MQSTIHWQEGMLKTHQEAHEQTKQACELLKEENRACKDAELENLDVIKGLIEKEATAFQKAKEFQAAFQVANQQLESLKAERDQVDKKWQKKLQDMEVHSKWLVKQMQIDMTAITQKHQALQVLRENHDELQGLILFVVTKAEAIQ
ncbi:hypothetical protein GOP47_0022023 [Adiantum capillus-veneris]|uniref:Uncharacterized protein n=1 Tax=Adiantum capillus-veneris TaxID=13818 RepID=A0A9D4Z8E4_ADICA|nr:hypothetical protein GOP47_0022023 [Adiantum capillus-veneris]